MSEPQTQPSELYAWLEVEPDGREGIIAAFAPELGGLIALVHRSRAVAERMGPLAAEHARARKCTVRMVRFTRAETVKEIP